MSIMEETRAKAKAAKPKKERKRGPSAAETMIATAMARVELFHDAARVPYVAVDGITYKVRSNAFRLWLTGSYHRDSGGKAANGEALTTAVNTLSAHAIHEGPQCCVRVRIAEHDGAIYYDLGDAEGRAVEIDHSGWRIITKCPVRFLASQSKSPAAVPARGGSISDLQKLLNCPDIDAFTLLTGWIAACFREAGPFPVLVLTGQQGSAKSTTARILKKLIDPEKVTDRSAPKELRDLAIWAQRSWLLSVDNVSGLPDWLSDGLCRLSTGGGFGVRALYTDDDESVFDAKRPIILNGITDFITRADLVERSIILNHPAIPDGQRRLESDILRQYDDLRSQLMGAIFDRLSAGIRKECEVDSRHLPRMADAARFAIACEFGMHEAPRFLEAFRRNQSDSHEVALDDSAIAPAIMALGGWTGTASELFQRIRPAGEKLPDGWPKRPATLSGQLRRIAPSLLKVHQVEVVMTRDKKSRVIVIRPVISRESASSSSSPSSDAELPLKSAFADDDAMTIGDDAGQKSVIANRLENKPDDDGDTDDDVSRTFTGDVDISAILR